MKKYHWFLAIFVFFAMFVVFGSSADPLSVTNWGITGSGMKLGWSDVANHYILAQRSSLTTDQFHYVGEVLATNECVVPINSDSCFYGIRTVKVVSFSDSKLDAVVRYYLPNDKYEPADKLYDIDAESVTALTADNLGISDVQCVSPLVNLASLSIQGNKFTNLDVSACFKLNRLDCGSNYSLTNLNLGGCRSLQWLSCANCGKSFTNLDISSCTNLGTLLCYGNNLTVLNIASNRTLRIVLAGGNPLTNIVVWWTPPNIAHKPANLSLSFDGMPVFTNPK